MMATKRQSLQLLLAGMLADPTSLGNSEVAGLSLDSRQVKTGWLFLALSTEQQQRQAYLKQALTSGASVVLFDSAYTLTAEEKQLISDANVAAYAVRTLADKAGEIAARFYGHPSLALTVMAITGTNGKTSVSNFIAQSLEALAIPCGVIGTLGVGRIGSLNTTGMTTPDPITLQAVLADFCQQEIKYVVIEASSHALEQGRLNSVAIDVAVLTNLTRDHLDYHHNMANYAAAKQRLFEFKYLKTAVINSADEFGQTLMESLVTRNKLTIMSYNSNGQATVSATNIEATTSGWKFDISNTFSSIETTINSALLGRFNIDNLLATIACLLAIDISFAEILSVIERCHSVDGRMQAYGNEHQTHVVIDFAHTPDALAQALKSLQSHVPAQGQLWCVFGCGGDRDKGKRPVMGRTAELYADRIVLTDDNPRGEQPSVIINEILAGLVEPEKAYIEHDRKQAIAYALGNASSGDIILIAGKGHEQYQEVSGVNHAFSDASVVTELHAANDKHGLTMRVGA